MRFCLLSCLCILACCLNAHAQDSRTAPLLPLITTQTHSGSSPFEPPQATDTTFVVDVGPGLDTGCTFRSGGPLKFSVRIDRVVGDVDPNGFLADPQTLISNGVVSKYAMLRMPAYDVDYDAVVPPLQPERDRILFNGKDIGPINTVAYLTGANNIWKLNEFQIPIEMVKFARRNPGAAPTPADNEIQILIDQANIPNKIEAWCTAIDWAEVSFQALAPVIMVHGNNESGHYWEIFNFVQPFKSQKIPYDNSISMTVDTIANHGTLLAKLIPDIAKSFGAKHVHLVAHSKGGLDARDFLARTIPPNFGVYSLTTLATPHHGSVGADYEIDAVSAGWLFSDSKVRTVIAKIVPGDAGTPNETVSFLTGFNATNAPLLPKSLTVDGQSSAVAYRSFSDDANLDNSTDTSGKPTIQENECKGIGEGSEIKEIKLCTSTFGKAMQIVYRTMGEVASVTLTSKVIGFNNGVHIFVYYIKETPTTTFQLNDFLVTVNSARMTGFTEIAFLKDNHATIANPNVAIQTITAIKAIQPVK